MPHVLRDVILTGGRKTVEKCQIMKTLSKEALKLPSSAEKCFLCCHIRKLLATSADLRVINFVPIDFFWLQPLALTSSEMSSQQLKVKQKVLSEIAETEDGKKRREITKEGFCCAAMR